MKKFERQAFPWITLLVSLLTLLACGSTTPKPSPQTSIRPTALPTPIATPFPNAVQIDAYLSDWNKKGVLSRSVLAAKDGMLFEKGYGMADIDARVPNTTRTRFRIGSVSKQFTAMAILILQERGKLHVQDSPCLYISDCPQDWQQITLSNLLTHSSGIPDYTDLPDFVSTWTQPTTPEALIARFKDLPLEFAPGSRFRYSNSGYVLLGYIIERVSRENYAHFLQENIFTPLGMRDTGYDVKYPKLPQHATGYYQGYAKPEDYDPSVFYAAGALYSTVGDLWLWDQALMRHTLVSEQTLNDMFALHIPCPPSGPRGCLMHSDLGYGYGWFLAAQPQGKLIYHVGRIDGFLAYNGFYPKSGLIVVVLRNLETTNVLGIGLKLAEMV